MCDVSCSFLYENVHIFEISMKLFDGRVFGNLIEAANEFREKGSLLNVSRVIESVVSLHWPLKWLAT